MKHQGHAKRAALYARVSTRDQDTQMQLDELRAEAERRGWLVVGEFVDQGISGAQASRPELDNLMKQVRRGRLDVVAVWKFDRFARSVRHLVTALDEFSTRNVDFVSLHDGIDTSTAVGRFTFHVVSAMAEFERELISERVSAGLRAAQRRGTKIGRPSVDLDIDRAVAMRAQGKSYRAIAKALGAGKSTVQRAIAEHEASSATA